jgi:prolyl-tRNA editing enzyme YbaK/EbsC (Cys-tRNA(Pro) deacylase)
MTMTEITAPQFSQPVLTQRDLQEYIDKQGIHARLIRDVGHTPTVPAAAQVLGVEPDQIIKTLLFVLDAGDKAGQLPPSIVVPPAVVVIGNGENRISKKALGEHFRLNPKRVKLAPAVTVIDLLGYPPGGVPPFGHRTPLPVILDQNVVALRERYDDRIFGGGGDDHAMLELTVSDLLRIHQPTVLALAEN